ncbi:MAG: hypothetical protein AABX02_04735 [archaeon]
MDTIRARGQVSMPDVLFASVLFMVLLAGMLYYANLLQTQGTTFSSRHYLDVTTANIAEYIIKNPGQPTNWEAGDWNAVTQIGLAQKDRVLSSEKVLTFVNQGNADYEGTKTRLNVAYYEFYAEFSGGVSLTTGQIPPASKSASVVERFVTINGQETTFTLTLYEP